MSIKPTTALSALKLIQNEVTNDFYIVGIENTAQLIVSDLNCRVLLKQEVVNEEPVSISSFRKGIYVVRIITAEGMVARKLVKT
jgi:hypothetical protein